MQYLLKLLSKAVVTAFKGKKNIMFCGSGDIEWRVFREFN
jgi:hypothetical protein